MRFAEINSSGETQLQKEKQKPWPTISREPGFRFLALALGLEDDLHAHLHNARRPNAIDLAISRVVDLAVRGTGGARLAGCSRAGNALPELIARAPESWSPIGGKVGRVNVRRAVAASINALVLRMVKGVERLPAEL